MNGVATTFLAKCFLNPPSQLNCALFIGISRSAGGDNDCYPMNQNPSGIAIIINNAVFENKTKLEYREGSEQDVSKMKELFKGLQFDVQVYRNRTACQMTEDIETLSHKDHTQYDCCVLFFMSHGREGEIYGTDGEVIKIKDITARFTAKSCPTLAGKPKLFFVQACRGSKADVGYDVIESPAEASPLPIQERNANEPQTDLNISQSRKISHIIPDDADIYFAFASSPRFAALRNTLSGGWFVNQLYEVMMKYASQEDLMSMMVRVTGNVADINCQNSPQKYKQCPQQCSQLRKKLFFRPRNVIQ